MQNTEEILTNVLKRRDAYDAFFNMINHLDYTPVRYRLMIDPKVKLSENDSISWVENAKKFLAVDKAMSIEGIRAVPTKQVLTTLTFLSQYGHWWDISRVWDQVYDHAYHNINCGHCNISNSSGFELTSRIYFELTGEEYGTEEAVYIPSVKEVNEDGVSENRVISLITGLDGQLYNENGRVLRESDFH